MGQNKRGKVKKVFTNYQLSMYLYSFATFLDVLFMKNYKQDYLDHVSGILNEMSTKFEDLCGRVVTEIKEYYSSATESRIVDDFGLILRTFGEAMHYVPGFEQKGLDDLLTDAGEKIGSYVHKGAENTIARMGLKENEVVSPFVESLNLLGDIYNKPYNLYFDEEHIYLE